MRKYSVRTRPFFGKGGEGGNVNRELGCCYCCIEHDISRIFKKLQGCSWALELDNRIQNQKEKVRTKGFRISWIEAADQTLMNRGRLGGGGGGGLRVFVSPINHHFKIF